MKPIVFPDYQNSILNITTSILKHYDVPTKYSSNTMLDEYLKKGFRNVVYILIDALGSQVLERHKDVASNLYRDFVYPITSVFPPTTVAATTTVLTGIPPVSSGWLGWCQYVKEVDKTVIFFTNKDYYSEDTIFSENLAQKVAPVKQIYEQIQMYSPDVSTHEIFPAFAQKEHDSFLKQCHTILQLTNEPGKHFIYTYWDKLDTQMHETGPGSVEVHRALRQVDKAYGDLVSQLSNDTVVIVIADHGQVDVCPIELRKYVRLWELFEHEPSIESRAATFFIKEGKHEQFKDLFNHYFKEYFLLFTKKQVQELNLFGVGDEHPRFDGFLGDFMAIAIDHFYFRLSDNKMMMRGQHAGLLVDEMMVPLIIHT